MTTEDQVTMPRITRRVDAAGLASLSRTNTQARTAHWVAACFLVAAAAVHAQTDPGNPTFDQEALANACRKADLPEPPLLADLPPDLATMVYQTNMRAIEQPNVETIGQLGRLYHALTRDRSQSDRAIACYQTCAELTPDDYRWPYYLGRMFLLRASYPRARIEFQKCSRLNPEYAPPHVWLGELERRVEAWDRAKVRYEKYIELAPDDAYGYVGVASAELFNSNGPAAYELLQKAIKLEPECGAGYKILANYYEAAGERRKAVRSFQKARRMPAMPRALVKNPLDLEVWLALGDSDESLAKVRAYAELGDSASVDALMDGYLAAYPKSERLLVGFSRQRQAFSDVEAGYDLAARALAAHPDSAAAMVAKSGAVLRLGDATEALRLGKMAEQADPNMPEALIAQGQALYTLQRPADALNIYRKALAAQPENVILMRTIGDIQRKMELNKEAIATYNETLDKAEAANFMPPAIKGTYVALADLLLQESDENIGEVKQLVLRAFRHTDDHAQAFRAFADVFVRYGRGEQAIAFCREMVTMNPKEPQFAILLGELLVETNQVDPGIQWLQMVCGRLPDEYEPHFALSVAYIKAGRDEEAIASLRRVLVLEPEYQQARLTLASILIRKHRFGETIDVLREGVDRAPNSLLAANSLAWALATTPDDASRSPAEAVLLAEKAVTRTHRQVATFLDTLAAAYAASGEFAKAKATEEEAIRIAARERAERERRNESTDDINLDNFQNRLKLYSENKSYVESASTE